MDRPAAHIAVCVCTYKRQRFLKRLLAQVSRQVTDGEFSLSIVVADNDYAESARAVVEEFKRASTIPITYCVQPEQNIALTRNVAIANARGDYVAFLDDDEMPEERWLVSLFRACRHYRADGVLGSAIPEYEGTPPAWVVRGRFYERPAHPTGFVIGWRNGRTGNVLLKRILFAPGEEHFRPAFLTGEDHDFFRRRIAQGHVFVWCNEAITHEIIPCNRWKRSFMLRRALLRGKISLLHPGAGPRQVLKATIAIPAYTVALPFLLLLGQHMFMRYLVKTVDHVGALLAFLGVDPIKEKYVTQ